MEFSTIRGFRDILPEEIPYWQRLEAATRRVFEAFGFQEIKTPLLEFNEVFSRGIGAETDIVSKEMYSLPDSKGNLLTLRPEATASVVRAYIQHRLYDKWPVPRLYSLGPMFRHERPQKGRYRQFHQINAELFNDPGPRSDADVIAMAVFLFREVGLKNVTLQLNSLGCAACRPRFRTELKTFLGERAEELCPDCQRRAELNPLRVFDCKVATCNAVVTGAPTILDFVCEDCQAHFKAVQGYLEAVGIPFDLNRRLVRGLDYYTHTTFEIQTEELGAQNAVAGGGRYDGLVQILGGPDHPGVGFAIGMERMIALMAAAGGLAPAAPDVFIAVLGGEAEAAAHVWAAGLRQAGIRVEMDYAPKGLKGQMKRADRLSASAVLIVGADELARGKVILRDMQTKTQSDVASEEVVAVLTRTLRPQVETPWT